MRLRLTVQRNGLPAANILWNVPDTSSPQAYTITRLLEDVNLIIPLEAEHWGLEHYVVELDGFECLHFSPVAQALKEDDRVCIRPLMTAEVRARTLTGRYQISDGGQHLVDGVPFGRPYLRQPSRPAVRIPPRKRRRLDDAEADDDVQFAGLLTASGEPDVLQENNSTLVNGHTSPGSETRRSSGSATKAVQFTQPEVQGDDDDSEEDDDDFAPGEESADDVSMDDNSSDGSDSDSDSDSGSNNSSSASGSSSSGSDSEDSSSDSESGESSAPDVISSRDGTTRIIPKAQPSVQHVPPGQGKAQTRSRNARRTQTNRLRHLKETGVLPQDASLDDLRRYEQGSHQSHQHQAPVKPFSTSTGKRKRLENEHEPEVIAEDAAELEKRKQELMARFGEQTFQVTNQTLEPAQTPVTEAASPSQPTLKSTISERSRPKPTPTRATEALAPSQSTPNEQQTSPSQTPQRLRPNVSAIARILARQAPAVKKSPKAKPTKEKTPEPEGASDPDFWKSRINLSAFECWEEDFELSAPPYPFKQHWDPASQLMRDKATKKRQKKGGKKAAPLVEEQEEDEEEKIILNYDDGPTEETPDADVSAAIENQLRQDVAIAAAQSDFPPLPEDIGTLPALTSADIKERAIIVCRFFAVNPITVTPEISDFKTAVVETEGDSGNGAGTIRLRIADRDLPKREKKFDSKGNQIYDAAAGFFMEDDDDDVGLWEGMFNELLEAKLLKAA